MHVTLRFFPAIGGVETYVMNLALELSELGIDVKVLTTDLLSTRPLRRLHAQYIKDPIHVIREKAYEILPVRQGLAIFSPKMIKYIDSFDLIHLHGYGQFPTYLAPICKVKKVPVVITTHSDAGLPSIRKKIFDIIIPRITLDNAAKIIAVSNHEKDVLIKRGVNRDKIVVIPNGINLDEFKAVNNVKRDNSTKIVAYAGRIDIEQKGLDILVSALAKIKFKTRDVRLRLIGPDWGAIDKLLDLATRLEVKDKIEYFGAVSRSEFKKLLSEADLFVLPSRFEPFGLVILEAMACKVPVIASNVGGIPEIVEHGKNGLLFEREDVDSLASLIDEILTNEDYANEIVQRAYSSIERFSWKRIVKEVINVYNEVLH